VRVILVGRTGVDGALRQDPQLELERAATPLEAVAILATPISDAPAGVVVVGADAEKSLREGSNGHGGGKVAEFIRGLRVANPAVVVLGVGARAEGSPFDGFLTPELSPEDLRRRVRSVGGGNGSSAKTEPVRPAPPQPQPRKPEPPAMPDPDGAASTDMGDLELVQLMVRGRDVLAPALALIRARTGDDAIEFVPQGADAPRPEEHAGDEPVTWEGEVLGYLRGRGVNRAMLALQARWLAAWLRLRDQQAQLRAAAFTDPLTGAYNRRYFERFLASALEQARTARRNVTIMLFDIDDFKVYNDRYGHDAGDEILRETVKLMRSTIRPTDRVCRIGGDEFAVIFYEPEGPRQEGSRHPASVFAIAQRFQQQVQQHRFPKLAGLAAGTLTISGGLATYPWDGVTVEQLLNVADRNALASKRQGKNAITFGPDPGIGGAGF
jgi:two-component system cell cycle response regulator